MTCAVTSIGGGGRVAQLTIDHQAVIETILGTVVNLGSMLAGHLVLALVTAVMPSGLNVKIGGFFDGTIDLAHLQHDEDIETLYKLGTKV